jgi:hypothetical protein
MKAVLFPEGGESGSISVKIHRIVEENADPMLRFFFG